MNILNGNQAAGPAPAPAEGPAHQGGEGPARFYCFYQRNAAAVFLHWPATGRGCRRSSSGEMDAEILHSVSTTHDRRKETSMIDPYSELYAAFLQDHPDAFSGLRMVEVDGEALMAMHTATLQRFISWALAQGLVPDPASAFGLLDALPAMAAQARQHGDG
jgi:hypothetical protein